VCIAACPFKLTTAQGGGSLLPPRRNHFITDITSTNIDEDDYDDDNNNNNNDDNPLRTAATVNILIAVTIRIYGEIFSLTPATKFIFINLRNASCK
jgi:hypothetical protein